MTTSFHQEFVSQRLNHTISSVDTASVVASPTRTVDVEETLNCRSDSVEDIVALDPVTQFFQMVF